MTLRQIQAKQNKIAKTLRDRVHPDNPLAESMRARYRELEKLKQLV